ncbi:MAG: hypothetical protein FWE32_11905 [Oscillospiraceae bacterium]|nr:hypothetical protein [Oscillospiraceae bacterium]
MNYSAVKEERATKSGVDIFTPEQIEDAQKEFLKELARLDREGQDSASFLIKYMRMRETNESRGVVENAKAMADNSEEYILANAAGAPKDRENNPADTITELAMTFKMQGGSSLSDAMIQEFLAENDFAGLLSAIDAALALLSAEYNSIIAPKGSVGEVPPTIDNAALQMLEYLGGQIQTLQEFKASAASIDVLRQADARP